MFQAEHSTSIKKSAQFLPRKIDTDNQINKEMKGR